MKTLLAFALLASPHAFSEVTDDRAVECAVSISDDTQVVLTSGADLFSIKLPSAAGRPMEMIYEKSDIHLFIRPLEAPAIECFQAGNRVTLWDETSMVDGTYLAEVNGRYFELANGTAVGYPQEY